MSIRSGPPLGVTLSELKARFPLAEFDLHGDLPYPVIATPPDLAASVAEAEMRVTAHTGDFPPKTAFSFLICVKCQKLFSLPVCDNCGHGRFSPSGHDIKCDNCDRYVFDWNCGECGTQNPFGREITGTVKNVNVKANASARQARELILILMVPVSWALGGAVGFGMGRLFGGEPLDGVLAVCGVLVGQAVIYHHLDRL